MPSRSVYLPDPLLAQLEVEARTAGGDLTAGKILVDLAMTALFGHAPATVPAASHVLRALLAGHETADAIAQASGLPVELVRATLRNLADLDGEPDVPVVRLVDKDGRAVWTLVAAA